MTPAPHQNMNYGTAPMSSPHPPLEPADDFTRGYLEGLALSISIVARSKGNNRKFRADLERAAECADQNRRTSPTPDYHRAFAMALRRIEKESY